MKVIPKKLDIFKTNKKDEWCIFTTAKKAIFFQVGQKGNSLKQESEVSEAVVSEFTPVLTENSKGLPIEVVNMLEYVRFGSL